MPDTDLFLSLAEIAGVFVGFGALIAVRSGTASDIFVVATISQVVEYAVMVVVLALAPVAISPLGVSDHALWWSCSLGFLAIFWLGDMLLQRVTPERRAAIEWMNKRAHARMRRLVYAVTIVGLIPMNLALIVILLGLRPDLDAALYFVAVVLLLVMDAAQLLWTVVGFGFPRPAPGAAGLDRDPA